VLATLLLGVGAFALGAGPAASKAPANRTGLRLKPVGRFLVPTFITSPPQDPSRLFVVERAGMIRIVKAGQKLRHSFLDVRPLVDSGGERGLLSMAFRPDFARSRLFYIYYTAKNGDLTVEEYRQSLGNPDRADPATRRRVMVIPHPNHNHNSGQLQFGPDGYLYVGAGDGGASGDPDGHGQDLRTRLGKIMRIDPTGTADLQYSVPLGNPYVGQDGDAPEIWASGFRNPWRFSFDRVTNDMVIADVGQDAYEEIDYVRNGTGAGENFGWSACEGTHAFPISGHPAAKCALAGSVPPVIEHAHAGGYCAVIGGVVVRDRSLAGLYGQYLYGDLCRPELRSARLSAAGATERRTIGLNLRNVITIGQDANNCVYVGTFTSIYRIAPAASTAPCPPGPVGPVVNPPADRRRPTVVLTASRVLPALRSGRIHVVVRCDEPCRIETSASLAQVKGEPLARVSAPVQTAAGGEVVGVTIPLGAIRGLFPAGSRAFASVRVRVLDRAHNARTVRRAVTLTH
jgi:glucose/arabinose dehydrogenase